MISKNIVKKKKLQDITDIQVGVPFRTKLHNDKEGNYSVIQLKDIDEENRIDTSDLFRVNLKKVKSSQILRKGDVVFKSRGDSLRAVTVDGEPGNFIVAAPMILIRVKADCVVLPRYLKWYINEHEAQNTIRSLAGGTNVKLISVKNLKTLEIPCPSLEKQEKIVEISELSEREFRLMKKLKQKRKQLISKILMDSVRG